MTATDAILQINSLVYGRLRVLLSEGIAQGNGYLREGHPLWLTHRTPADQGWARPSRAGWFGAPLRDRLHLTRAAEGAAQRSQVSLLVAIAVNKRRLQGDSHLVNAAVQQRPYENNS
jgi:hypothetical protein